MPESTPASPQKSTTVRSYSSLWPSRIRLLQTGFGLLSRVSPGTVALAAERLILTPRRHPRPARERELLRLGRSFAVCSQDGPLAAWEWGSAGERVLLVHGWEGRGTQLGELVAPLRERGFRVVAFDAPGHGHSPGSRSSFFHFARAIERVGAELGPFRALVAHSMGGPSAAWASRSAPLAERMVMIAPPADLRDFVRSASAVLGLNAAAMRRVDERFGRRFGVALEQVQAARIAPSMRTPLLVVHDEDDREVSIQAGEFLAEHWPGAKLVRTRGLGHRRILRDASTLEAVARFVAA